MLIDALVGVSQEGLLVVRDQLELTSEGRSILASLDPFRLRQVRGASWPGTELTGHLATLTYFRACAEAGVVLKSAVQAFSTGSSPRGRKTFASSATAAGQSSTSPLRTNVTLGSLATLWVT